MGLNEVRPGRPEQFGFGSLDLAAALTVSMKSGLEDRNNALRPADALHDLMVSMKSGLEDRNNDAGSVGAADGSRVSMKSGLEDRNNQGLVAVLPALNWSQ